MEFGDFVLLVKFLRRNCGGRSAKWAKFVTWRLVPLRTGVHDVRMQIFKNFFAYLQIFKSRFS
jgi:hypothetical protein